jgi:hypothetical protein
MDKIKLAQRTIAMLSSMIESGECHTARSREMKDNALNGLEQLTIPVVVQSLPKRLSNVAYLNAREMRYEDFISWWDEQV